MIAAVPNFLPSLCGFQFPNVFPCVPVRTIHLPFSHSISIGDASGGLCGGMVHAVRDHYEAGLKPLPGGDSPGPDSPLFTYLVDRLFDSFDIPYGIATYLKWMLFRDEDHLGVHGAARRAVESEWPDIRDDIDSGRLCPLGLVTVKSANPLDLKHNHQVLAYGYEVSNGAIAIRVYDPNRPGDDGAAIQIVGDHIRPRISYPGGPNVRAFFRTKYTPGNLARVLGV